MSKERITRKDGSILEYWEDIYNGDTYGYDCSKFSFENAYKKFLSDSKKRFL